MTPKNEIFVHFFCPLRLGEVHLFAKYGFKKLVFLIFSILHLFKFCQQGSPGFFEMFDDWELSSKQPEGGLSYMNTAEKQFCHVILKAKTLGLVCYELYYLWYYLACNGLECNGLECNVIIWFAMAPWYYQASNVFSNSPWQPCLFHIIGCRHIIAPDVILQRLPFTGRPFWSNYYQKCKWNN